MTQRFSVADDAAAEAAHLQYEVERADRDGEWSPAERALIRRQVRRVYCSTECVSVRFKLMVRVGRGGRVDRSLVAMARDCDRLTAKEKALSTCEADRAA